MGLEVGDGSEPGLPDVRRGLQDVEPLRRRCVHPAAVAGQRLERAAEAAGLVVEREGRGGLDAAEPVPRPQPQPALAVDGRRDDGVARQPVRLVQHAEPLPLRREQHGPAPHRR